MLSSANRYILKLTIKSSLLIMSVTCLLSTGSLAQAQDLQFLLPTQGQQSYIHVEGVRVLKPGKWNLSAYTHYGRDPLLLIVGGQVEEVLVRYITTTEVVAALGVHERFELGVAIPYSFSSGVNGTFPVDDAQGLGDIRLNPKVILLKPKDHKGLGIGFNMLSILPTGNYDRDEENQRFVRRNFSSIFNLAGEYFFEKGRVALNLGYRLRPLRGTFDQLTDLDVATGPTWSIAGGYPVDDDLEVTAELFQRFMSFERSPVESLLGVRSTRDGALNVHFGMGAGVGGDFSSVGLRILGGITWTPQPNSGGGMPITDRDKDGLIDIIDRCPTEPEDRDGHEDFDGCPEDDVDGDGIKDELDRCPTQPEDRDQFQDDDGCPELDNDADTIPDQLDRCPNKPETFNQIDDKDGCPDEAPVPEEGELIGLSEKIFFQHNESIILQKSYPVLEQVASLLKRHPQIAKVRIEGHTDDTGGIQFNLNLSQERAEAVKLHLVGLGIEMTRLDNAGYGDQRPIASNDTEEGRALNRRVDFRILKGPQEIFKVDVAPPKVPTPTIQKLEVPKTQVKHGNVPDTGVSVGGVPHAIQIKASYRLTDAEKIRELVSKERFPAYILSIQQDDGPMIHRVRIGPYSNKVEANQALSQYRARFPDSSGEYMVKISSTEAKKYR